MPGSVSSTAAFCAAPDFRFHLQVVARPLHFHRPARTSRGELEVMERYEIEVLTHDGRRGVGEATPMPGLSVEGGAGYGRRLHAICEAVNEAQALAPDDLLDAASMRFGIEIALLSARVNGAVLWDSPFSRGRCGLAIHHLIWMDTTAAMLTRMAEGVAQGFRCLKLKVGALPWAEELALLHEVHNRFPLVEIRVDANGAWTPEEAPGKLAALAAAGVELIEQPIKPRQRDAMARLMDATPLSIALDEELISARTPRQRRLLLDALRPHALVIKPSLHGGFSGAEDWAQLASERGIRWWINSALEGPVGHAALAEWCGLHAPSTLHGLGTGQLYRDAAPGRVQLCGCELRENRFIYRTISNLNSSKK